jgi:hypothetical protein
MGLTGNVMCRFRRQEIAERWNDIVVQAAAGW